jgi:peptidoglycan/xylan/chitin deacetylase (PgdA/CDA1 family)
MRVRPALIVLTAIVVAVVAASSSLHGTTRSSAASATATTQVDATTVAEPVKDQPMLTLPDPLPTRTVRVPILMYHRIAVLTGDEPAVTVDLTVDPGEFTLEMQWLKDNGYTSITQMQLYSALQEGKPLPDKPVMITFDDGYRGIATIAAPIMTRVGMVGTAYVITDRIANLKKTAPTWLTWSQLRTLERRGWDIGSHTVAHTEIPHMTPKAALKTLRASRLVLEKHLAHPVQWFCYPAGSVNAAAVELVKQAGYVLATTTKSGDVHSSADPLQLSRIRVSNDTGVRGLAAALSF